MFSRNAAPPEVPPGATRPLCPPPRYATGEHFILWWSYGFSTLGEKLENIFIGQIIGP